MNTTRLRRRIKEKGNPPTYRQIHFYKCNYRPQHHAEEMMDADEGQPLTYRGINKGNGGVG